MINNVASQKLAEKAQQTVKNGPVYKNGFLGRIS